MMMFFFMRITKTCLGQAKKGIQDAPPALNPDDGPSHATEARRMESQSSEPNPKRQKTGGNEGRRNKASPARLFKLNKDLVSNQKGVIIGKEFGGLLDLAANSMPGDLSQWIMKHCDPEMSQIVIPDRGKIPVDAASVQRIWGLPNKGRKGCYENRPEITKAMFRIYNITSKNSPTLIAWCKMIKDMAGAHDDDFLRAWLSLVFSCFLAPSTSLSISNITYLFIINNIYSSSTCSFKAKYI